MRQKDTESKGKHFLPTWPDSLVGLHFETEWSRPQNTRESRDFLSLFLFSFLLRLHDFLSFILTLRYYTDFLSFSFFIHKALSFSCVVTFPLVCRVRLTSW